MLSCLCTGLDKVNPLLNTPFVNLSEIYLSSKIFFSSHEQVSGIRYSFLSHLIPSLFNPFPTPFIRKVKNQNNTITGFKVSCNNTSISFLSSSIPNTEANLFITDFDLFISKVNSGYSYIERFLLFNVSPENGGLACPTFTNKDDFVSELL